MVCNLVNLSRYFMINTYILQTTPEPQTLTFELRTFFVILWKMYHNEFKVSKFKF